MKIVQLLPELNEGGVERGTVELNREMVKRGLSSIVISAGGKLAVQIENDGGHHISLDICSKNPLTVHWRIVRLRKLLRELKPDVIHARSRVPAWLSYLANRPLKIPFVTTVHGFNSVNAYSRIMTYGDRVICVSGRIKYYIQKNYGVSDKKIIVINRGLDPSEFDPDRLNQKWIDSFKIQHSLNEKYIVTSVGRITELKDYDTFIRAVKNVSETIPNILGLIVGGVRHDKQDYYERLQRLVQELHVDDQVVFAGSHSHLSEIYALSDVLVSCSKKPESFGRTMIEAMAMNTPVIATRHGGALDIVEEGRNGFLVSPENVKELADALLRQKEIDTTGLRDYILNHFLLDQMVEKTIAVYKQLVI